MGLGGPKESARAIAQRKLVWQTWILHACLGYVSRHTLAKHVGSILGLPRTTVENIVGITTPDGCFAP